MDNRDADNFYDQSVLDESDFVNDLFYALFNNSPVGTILVDNKLQLMDANRTVFKYFDQEEMPVKGRNFGNLFKCEVVCGSSDRICGTQESCKLCQINLSLKKVIKSAEKFDDIELSHQFQINGRIDRKWFSISATPVRHNDENYAIVTLVDITERKRREETLVLLGITDELTGIFNRRFIIEQIEKNIGMNSSQPMVLAMLDIDNFKTVNDTYGHITGDEVLRTLSSIIKRNIRYSDFAGRYGGEEFLILIPESDLQIGVKIIERIKARFIAQDIYPVQYPVTFSAGVVEVPADGKKPDFMEVIARADSLMYIAKANGRNRIVSGQI